MPVATISHHSYGKSGVRLLKVRRGSDGHADSLRDLCVNIALEGDFEATYLTGDNRSIIATDTMKNLVYVHGHQHPIDTIEAFGLALSGHFLDEYKHVSRVSLSIAGHPWKSIDVDGQAAPRALMCQSNVLETVDIQSSRGESTVESGIRGVDILKTGDSAFRDFHHDPWTTLRDADQRLFRTYLNARWRWKDLNAEFAECNSQIIATLLKTFAEHHSLSVQQTLHTMASAALDCCRFIDRVSISLPNRHCNLVDLSPFGLKNTDQVYAPTEEPFGLIEAVIER